MNNKDILITSPQGMPVKGYDYRNLYQSSYRCGVWEQDSSFTIQEEFKEIDHGHNFYVPQSFMAADGRRIMVGWMSMWNTAMPTQKQEWANAFTLPYGVNYNEQGRLLYTPIIEREQLRTSHDIFKPFTITNIRMGLAQQYQEYKNSFNLANSTAE